MSALPPKADIGTQPHDVRFVPKADIAALFDHLVGAGTHRWRYGEAKRFSGLEIDHWFVLGWRLYWQVGRLLALEDPIDVASRAAKLVKEIRPIRNQSPSGNIIAFIVERGQLVPGGKSDNQITIYRRQRPSCRSPSNKS